MDSESIFCLSIAACVMTLIISIAVYNVEEVRLENAAKLKRIELNCDSGKK